MLCFPIRRGAGLQRGFTLLEMLVSFAVLAVLLVLFTTMISRTTSIWSYTRGQAEQFREARDAFDALTRKLGEATLGTYMDYEDASGLTRTSATSTSFVPQTYGRQSELRFLCGPGIKGDSHAVFFQAPLGKTSGTAQSGDSRLLNTVGYYLEYGSDASFLPSFIKPRNRLRLMEFCEPSDDLSIYRYTSGTASPSERESQAWFTVPLAAQSPPVTITAENIIALILLPVLPASDLQAGAYSESSLAPNYTYNSTERVADPNLNPRNQLPPIVRVTMIATDETSAARLSDNQIATLRSEVSTRFKNASNYNTDLQQLQAKLTELGVSFRVFTTNVILKNAKWSREQAG